MQPFNRNSPWKKYRKFSIWVLIIAGLSIVTVLSFFTQKDIVLLEPLPTWQVNNPASKVFVMDEIPPTAGSLASGDSTVPNEYLDDPAIDTLFLMMQTQGIYLYKTSVHPSGIVGSDDIVIIKGSFQWDFRNTTSTDRIKGLIWKILQHPDGFTGEILVGDNTQWAPIGEDDNNSEDPNQCILDVINTFHSKGYPVYLFRWADIMYNVVSEYSDGDYTDGYPYELTSKISYPKFQSPEGTYISLKYGIWNPNHETYDHDRLCIVDFPVLKAHGWTGATLAIKNWVGVLTVAHQDERYGGNDAMHFDYFFSEYALPAKVMQVTYPKLTIIDAEWTNPERNYGNIAIQLNMLLGSTDPFAASWYAAKYMLTPVAYYPAITNPDLYTAYNSYGNFLLNNINCMHDSGFAVTKDSSEISVYDRSVLSTVTTFNLTVTISDGWNMVSVPGVNPNGQGIEHWWPDKDPAAQVIKYSGVYQPVTIVTSGEGYWMKHLGLNTYNTGDEWPPIQVVPHDPINATEGWNLIGGYENIVSTSDLTTLPPGLIEGPVYEYSNGYQAATNLIPGYSYWIKLSDTGDLILPQSIRKGNNNQTDLFKEDWGKIIITDAANRNYTLYAVTGNDDLKSYELPPVPPSGMFDIRYESDRIAENINKAKQIIRLAGILHPIKVRVENIDLILQDETGNELNEKLRSGEEIIIRNNEIMKLLIKGEAIPQGFVLYQNYPNPFNPSTKIRWHSPVGSWQTLKVYDLLGSEVATLINEYKPAGEYEVEFNSKGGSESGRDAFSLSSGIYLYKLQVGRYTETKKMILLR